MDPIKLIVHGAMFVGGPVHISVQQLASGDWDIHCAIDPSVDFRPVVTVTSLIHAKDERLHNQDLHRAMQYAVYMAMLKFAEDRLRDNYRPAKADLISESADPPPPKAQA